MVLWFIGLSLMLAVLFYANLWYGSVLIQWTDIFSVLMGKTSVTDISRVIVLEYRLPQAITALSVGMGLGVAGLLLQTIFRNPLAGPSVLGISSGASLGVAIVILLGTSLQFDWLGSTHILSELGVVFAAFSGALLVLGIILFASGRIANVVSILIIGIMIGYTVSAIVGFLQFMSHAEELHAYVLWGLGSFSNSSSEQSVFLLISMLIVVGIGFVFIKPLNALLMGESYARSVGVNTTRVQRAVIILSGLIIALATAFTGPIAFIGLAVPHLARNLFRSSNHGLLIPSVLLMGSILTLLCNLIAKLPGYDTSLPINAVTSLIGAPIVIWVIVKRGRLKKG